ncbi:MAG: glutaredoxin family protein [Deltaproteobacteria bacterium]|nr:glutaredoxin family protein [Deltaproteobacteria bacterium]
MPFTLEETDISLDPELEARFGQEIPVLFINGRKAFKYRLTAGELRRRLARESPVT